VPVPIVLIVEDDVDLREALCELLEEEGVAVVRADDGEEALKLLREGLRPVVVLLDLMMPRMNGIEFRRRQLLESPEIRDIPLVVLSGWLEGREEVKKLGVAAVLSKPVSAEVLCEVLRVTGRWIPT
jgi:two-component system, chemotaxis family, chemotaxis protein CheY